MSSLQPLQGSCSCGRYSYVVVIPENAQEKAQVHFRTDDDHRRSQAALLTAFLRVPLTWYTSNTTSFFPDETHHSISRTFSPVNEPYCQRKFCGYCGTHLSYWTEEPQEEQNYVNVTLGSLRNRDLDTLQDLELLPEDVTPQRSPGRAVTTLDASRVSAVTAIQLDGIVRNMRHGTDGPITWFEEMLDGSHLGRTRKTRKGAGRSADGATTVTWEVSEYGGDEDDDIVMVASESSAISGAKRKLGDDVE